MRRMFAMQPVKLRRIFAMQPVKLRRMLAMQPVKARVSQIYDTGKVRGTVPPAQCTMH